MVVAGIHPSVADLEAFTLGMLDDAALAAVEAHVADCPACQERAADSSGDNLVEVLRRVHARTPGSTDTVTEAGQARTPGPLSADAKAVSAAQAAPASADGTEIFKDVPRDLARHERYRVVRLLGAGGMGSVYEAEHRVMQRAVAVKVINSAFTSRPAAVERFRREVRAAARLAHPNIVTTYDAEDAGNTLFLVMEYVEGVSLARLVREQGPLSLAQACDYVRQAALGLQHAHERGMVHRDVKPDNLMLVSGGVVSGEKTPHTDFTHHSPLTTHHPPPHQVKVLDFGLAALTAEPSDGLTDTNAIMGTSDYMAPEQAEAPHGADIRADVYSLGCTLYYLLTGKVPYPAPTSLLKILAHRDLPVPAIGKARPEVPPELATIMARLLAKKPEDRYQTPGEVAAVLEAFAASEAKKRQLEKAPGRKRGWLVASAAAALFFGLLLGGAVYRVQTDKGELIITTLNDDVEVVIKQGGKQVDVIDTKTRKSIRLWSGTYDLELKGTPEGLKLDINNVTLMRDKTVLAKIERVAKGAVPADPAAVQLIQPLHRFPFGGGDRFFYVDVTQDGRFVLAGRGKVNRTRVWDVQSGKLICELDGTLARFTPDGNHVIATTWNEFIVYDLPAGKLVRRFASPDQISTFDLSVQCHNFWLSADGTILYKQTASHHEIYDWNTGEKLCRIPRSQNFRAFLSRDGRHLLTQPNGKPPLRALDTATGKEVDAFRQLRDVPLLASMCADGNRLICFDGRQCKLHDVATGKQVAEFEEKYVRSVLSGDGRLFLTGTSQRDEYGVWDVDTGRPLARLQFSAPLDGMGQVSVSRDGRFAVFAGPGDFVYVFRLAQP